MEADHPWQSASDEFKNVIYPVLQEHGKAIGQAYAQGNEAAKDILKYYNMLRRSFDPMTLEMLRQSMVKYGCLKEVKRR